jgi:hypothetical protein
VEKYGGAGQATDDNMAHALCMLATETHSEYVILIAFPRQQWLRERASMLHYTYIACLARSYGRRKSELLHTPSACCRNEDFTHQTGPYP